MEGVREEIGQEPALGVFHAGYVGNEPQGGPIAHRSHHRIQANALELVHIGLGADEVVAQEHHGLPAQLVGDVHHLLGQGGHLPALEGHKVLKLLGGGAVLVVVVPLVDDELRVEFIARLFFKPLQNIGGYGGRVAVPVHIFLPLQLIENQGELVEEGGVTDHIHVGVVRDELAQPLHGEFVGLGLTHIEGDLVLKVGPAIGNRVIHVHGVPDDIGQEAHRIVVELLGGIHHHTARPLLIAPRRRRQGPACAAVHHLPPALDIVPGVHLQQLVGDPLHQRNGQRTAHSGVESCGDVALLHLIRVGLRPGVVLPGGVVGGVNLGVHPFQGLRVIGAVAVPDGVRPPALEKLQGLGYHVHIGGNGNPAEFLLFFAH